MDQYSQQRRPRRSPAPRGDQRFEPPHSTLRGGDPLRGGRPCAAGHAGRASLSLADGLRLHTTALKRSAQVFAVALIIMLVQAIVPLSCSPTTAWAASGNDPKTVTLSTEFRHQLDGQEAYCTNIDMTPPPVGMTMSSWTSGPLMLDYVLYHSEGGFDVQYGWEPARYAVWAITHNDTSYLDTYGSGEPMPEWFSSQVKAIYQAAKGWVDAGAHGPERGCSRIYAPAGNAYQPLAICVSQLGDIELKKVSSLPAISDGDACYTLKDAQYTIYSDEACSSPVTTLTTDELGLAQAADLVQGTYWVRETKAPMGFAQNDTSYSVEVQPLATARIAGGSVSDQPLYAPAGILLRKGDAEMTLLGAVNQAQGDAGLAGARFVVKRYANTTGETAGNAVRSWTVETDQHGIATLDEAHLVSGDDAYRDENGAIVLPLGTYTIDELVSPLGYLLGSGQSCCFVVEQQGSRAAVRVISGPTPSSPHADDPLFLVTNDVIRGGVRLGKVDAQRGDHTAQGQAALSGAKLAIELTSEQPVIVQGTSYSKGQVVTTLTIGADGTAATSSDALPYGSYVVYEVEAPEGYLLTNRDSWSLDFQIREDGRIVDLSDGERSVPDQVKRGDLAFVKVDGRDMRRLACVPFVIESLTTGERHVLVTDENGEFSSSSSFNAHSYHTNANDFLFDSEGMSAQAQPSETGESENPVEAQPEDASSTETGQGDAPANDTETEELTIFDMARDAVNAAVARLGGEANEDATSEDTPLGDELQATQEELGDDELEDASQAPTEDEGEVASPVSAAAEQETVDTSAGIWFSGGTDMQLSPDDRLGALPYDNYRLTELRCAANEGYELVSFEVRVSRDHYLVDLGTVDDHALPTLQTKLATISSQESGDVWQLADTVYYGNLETDGTEYELRGELHLVAEDGSDGGLVTDADGNPLVASTTFKPVGSNGQIDVPFTLDVRKLRGKKIVAFEELWLKGELIARHCDVSDEDQSVTITNIATTLTDEAGMKEIFASDSVTLVDTVSYEGLVPGKLYTLTGTLMDKESGQALTDAQGANITAERSFTPEEASGVIEIPFTFDGSLVLGHQLVAFESLSQDGIELAVHADIEDEAQTVTVPSVCTIARDADDGDQHLPTAQSAHITDAVSHTGLSVGEEYLLRGTLVDRATGEPILKEELPVTAELAFTPKEADDTVEMTFEFDSSKLRGREVTVFEQLYHDERLVAHHEDLSSDEQSLSIPTIGTVATAVNGGKLVEAASGQKLVDTVRYEGLTPGYNYLITGVLHLRDDKGADAGVIRDDKGNPVSVSAPLVPEASSGEARLTFEVDASKLGGRDLVVFEQLTTAEGKHTVAVHEDISDGGQSISVKQPPTTPPSTKQTTILPRTSDIAMPVLFLFVSSAFALGLGYALRIREKAEQAPRHSAR